MKIFGLSITKATPAAAANLMPIPDRGRGWYRIFEAHTGNWQRNITVDYTTVTTFHAIFACRTLLASDFAKLGVSLVKKDADGIWEETTNPSYSPVLRKPNRFQNRIQYWENYLLSKLGSGNTYVLKERDGSRKVKALYVLDPCRVTPLVADDGSVYYRLKTDNLAGVGVEVVVPASEIIHDRYNCLYHPLVGLSPIVACGVAATQGMAIQNNQTNFFNNSSMPGGILVAPGNISNETALRLKTAWDTKYTGENRGKVAVLGDGLKFEKIGSSAYESQLIDQLKWTAEVCCSVHHVPGYKVGVGQVPQATSVQSLNLEYYSQGLQRLIEDAELCLDEGLGLSEDLGIQFDIDNLLRMDTVSQIEALDKAKNIMKLNEQRKRMNLPRLPVGGDTVYRQQQDFSVEALAKRDAKEDPFETKSPPPAAGAPGGQQPDPNQGPPPPKKDFDIERDPEAIAKAVETLLAA